MHFFPTIAHRIVSAMTSYLYKRRTKILTHEFSFAKNLKYQLFVLPPPYIYFFLLLFHMLIFTPNLPLTINFFLMKMQLEIVCDKMSSNKFVTVIYMKYFLE